MDTIERRFMEANFAVERASEAIANAETALKRAEIALEIGELDQQSAVIDNSKLVLKAPFDGVLVGFDANVGDCIQEGELAARIYKPDEKSVDVFFRISRLTAPEASGAFCWRFCKGDARKRSGMRWNDHPGLIQRPIRKRSSWKPRSRWIKPAPPACF